MTTGTVIELEAVMTEIRRLRKMNAPHVRERERRRKENNHRIKTGSHLPLLKLSLLPYKLARRSRELLKAEHVRKKLLEERSPEEWTERINALPVWPRVRKVAADICWWDYFATRKVSERWPHLDEFLRGPVPNCEPELVARALESLGYSAWMAKQRSEGGSEMEDGMENQVDGDDEDALPADNATCCTEPYCTNPHDPERLAVREARR